MKSVYGKLFVGFLLSLILSLTVTGYFVVKKGNTTAENMALSELKASGEHISNLMKLISHDDLDKILHNYASTANISFQIITQDKIVQYGHKTNILSLNKEKVNKILKDFRPVQTHSMKGNIFSYTKAFKTDNKMYIVNVTKDMSDSARLFIDSYVLSALIMFFGGTIVFMVISDFIVKPISRLTKATNELIKGNYKVRVVYSGKDEIGRLSQSFNQMAIQLAKQDETRQQFISDVSHEFQTPLTAINGFATILKNEELDSEQRRKYADIIMHNSQRLSILSKNMLQLTLLEGEDITLDIEKYSLIEQINRIIEMTDNEALAKDIEIEFKRPRGDIFIEADSSRMEQVWLNIISNAIKYTKPKGVITIEIKKKSNEIEISIEDTGVGMSQEALSHIYERFYREDKSRSVQGNGLGLSIVKRIIDLHNFKLDVKSQEDVGTIFTVFIPYQPLNELRKRLNIKRD